MNKTTLKIASLIGGVLSFGAGFYFVAFGAQNDLGIALMVGGLTAFGVGIAVKGS